jgi:hypothetical protein
VLKQLDQCGPLAVAEAGDRLVSDPAAGEQPLHPDRAKLGHGKQEVTQSGRLHAGRRIAEHTRELDSAGAEVSLQACPGETHLICPNERTLPLLTGTRRDAGCTAIRSHPDKSANEKGGTSPGKLRPASDVDDAAPQRASPLSGRPTTQSFGVIRPRREALGPVQNRPVECVNAIPLQIAMSSPTRSSFRTPYARFGCKRPSREVRELGAAAPPRRLGSGRGRVSRLGVEVAVRWRHRVRRPLRYSELRERRHQRPVEEGLPVRLALPHIQHAQTVCVEQAT